MASDGKQPERLQFAYISSFPETYKKLLRWSAQEELNDVKCEKLAGKCHDE